MHPTLTHTNSNGSQMNIFSESIVQIKTVLANRLHRTFLLTCIEGKSVRYLHANISTSFIARTSCSEVV